METFDRNMIDKVYSVNAYMYSMWLNVLTLQDIKIRVNSEVSKFIGFKTYSLHY